MFTQCPKCQSVFMVSDKDMKAHEGLVRCGNCYSVFNSSWNLTDDPRNDFIEEPDSTSTTGLPGSRGSGFTFNILDKAVNIVAATESLPAAADTEVTGSLVHQEDSAAGMPNDLMPDNDLEPFPEPEVDDFHSQSSAPVIKKHQEELLYFDPNVEDTEIEVTEGPENGVPRIEDLTLLQTPSFTNEIPALDQDDPAVKSEFDGEPVMGSLDAESMWPGGEAKFESEDEASVDTSIIVEPSTAALSTDSPVVEAPAAGDPLSSTTLGDEGDDCSSFDNASAKDEILLQDEEEAWLVAAAIEAENVESMPSLESNEKEATPEELQEASKSFPADDTFSVAGDEVDTDEFFSIESLPKTANEAFSREEEVENIDESVFITSEEEEVDEAYVPISLKGERDGSLHGLDDFPEPGELSALNYEDTMEINAMLEEANISKEQIESALSAAEVGDEEEGATGPIEEIFLSTDADNDLTEALFSSDGVSGSDQSAAEHRKDRTKPFVSYIKNLMPLGLGQKKAWKEPVIADDQTQLIQSLNRGRNKPELPVWAGKYSLLVAISILFITLLGQVGYFYMDKLVRITPLIPLLKVGCKIAGCTVPNIQNIGKIDQLSSGLTPLAGRGGGFKVSSILVNRDTRAQSFPALELTLTDRAGNMISRRVVTRDKYLTKEKPTVMMPNEAVDIDIRFRTPSIRVDGFELRSVSQNWLERSK